MFRAIAFVVIQTLFLISLSSPQCLAGDVDNKQATPPITPSQKQEMKTRGFHQSAPMTVAPVPLGASPPPAPRGDGGRPDETVGGLPGHSMEPQARQP